MANRFPRQTYNGGFVGYGVRRSLGGDITFRVRRGNGYYGSILGHRYQDKFTLVIPSSINNPESEPYRRQWIAAVHKWIYDLTGAEKLAYHKRASRRLHMSGFNLFMREAMRGEVEMYVDRGDPASYDYVKENLSLDGAWHDLDLSSLVPAGAKAILLKTRVQTATAGDKIQYRKNGNTNEINACGCEALRANVIRTRLGITSLDGKRVIEYKADNISWTTLDIVVRGWWT